MPNPVRPGACAQTLLHAAGNVSNVPQAPTAPAYSAINCSLCAEHQKSNRGRTGCNDLPLANLLWSDPSAVIFTSLTALGLFMTSLSFIIFLQNQETPLVKASNRELSFVLLVSIAICFALTLLHIAEPTNAVCCLRQALRYIAYTVYVSVLFLKTNRIVRAFQTEVIPQWFRKYVLGPKRQLLVVCLLNVIEVLLVIMWLTVDPSHVHRDIRTGQYIFLTCKPYRTVSGETFQAIIFIYLILMALLCTFYAFKARKVPENFNETKYIGFSMYILLISWIAFYPVDSALEGSYITIVACATSLLSAYGLLVCMFGPKLFIILCHPEQNTTEFMRAEVESYTARFSVKLLQRVRVRPATSDPRQGQDPKQNEGMSVTCNPRPGLDPNQNGERAVKHDTKSGKDPNQNEEKPEPRDLKSSGQDPKYND